MEKEFEVFFPKISDSIHIKHYYSLLRKRIIEQLKKIQGQDNDLEGVDEEILAMSTPKSFQGKESFEVRMIKNFEETVIWLSQHFARDPKEMTVLEFYQATETIQNQQKAK